MMKTNVLFAAAVLSLTGTSAWAQASLPAGIYDINGTVTSVTGGACPLIPNRPVTGHIYYPGVGRDTTQLLLETEQPGKTVTVAFLFAFPPVPAEGLNGWSGTNYVSPNYSLYQNGKGANNGEPAVLTFALAGNPSYLPFVQGTFGIKTNDDGGPCSETVQVVLVRVSPFKQIKE